MSIRNILFIFWIGVILISCGGQGVKAVAPIQHGDGFQIDQVTTIPVMYGNATKSIVYVHNDGDTTIKNIRYTLVDSSVLNGDIVDKNGFTLYSSSVNKCAILAAHSFCTLEFSTPSLVFGQQASAVLHATINSNTSNQQNFSQLLNYAFYDPSYFDGVNIAASVNIDNTTVSRYLTSYIVAGSKLGNKTYNNVNLQISNLGMVSLQQGFVNGQQVSAGQLIPVEFKVSPYTINNAATIVPTYSVTASNTVQSSLNSTITGGTLFINYENSTQNNYHFGLVPLLSANQSATVYITSYAPTNWSQLVITPGSHLQISNNTCSGSALTTYCSYQLSATADSNGSSQVTSSVAGNTADIQTVYYKVNPTQLDDVVISNSQSIYNVTLNDGTPSNTISFVFYNVGNESAYNLTLTPTALGSSSLEVLNSTCPVAPSALAPANSCVVNTKIVPSSSGEVGAVYFNVTSNNSKNVQFSTQSSMVGYSVISSSAPLIFTAPANAEANLQIAGDGVATQTATFTLYNPNSANVTINGISLRGSNLPSSLVIKSTDCGTSLSALSSCNVIVQFGPQVLNTTITGGATLLVNYGQSQSLNGTINYVGYSSFDSYLSISSVTTSGFVAGTGISANPYLARSCLNKTPSIVVTYKNMSASYTATQLSFDVSNGSLSQYLMIDASRSTCGYGSVLTTLAPLQECNLVFIPDTTFMITGSVYSLNLVFPTATWNTTSGFVEQSSFSYNGINGVFAQYIQPEMLSTLTPINGASLLRSLTQTVSNAESCSSIGTTISSLRSFGVIAPPTIANGNCQALSDGSIGCVNSSTQTTNQINYTIPNDLILPVNMFLRFTPTSVNEQLWFNPTALVFKVES